MPMRNPNIASSTVAKSNIQANTIGLSIELELREGYVVLDISSATVIKIKIKKPNGTILFKDASFLTDGKDGKIRYLTIEGDIDIAGTYIVQGYIEIPNFIGYSTLTEFVVFPNI